MRRLIWADFRRILAKKTIWVAFIISLAYALARVFTSYFTYNREPLVAVKTMMASLALVSIIISLVLFNAIYSDDFKSMSYVSVIGRGIQRKKVVYAKLVDILILHVAIYGIMMLVTTWLVVRPMEGFNHSLTVAWFASFFLTIYKSVGYIALSSMVLYITGNIPLGSVVLVILHIAVPFSAEIFSILRPIKALHLDRLHYAGLADNAVSDIMFGSYTSGIFKLLFGLIIYLGVVIAVTTFLFDKKELEF